MIALTALCFINSPFGHTQTHIIDSLRNVVTSQQNDTGKVNTLDLLSRKLWGTGKFDSSMDCAHTEQVLAEKLSFKKGIAAALRNIGIIYENQSDYAKALIYANKALALNTEIGNKKGIADNYCDLGILYNDQGNYTGTLEYCFKSLDIYKQINNQKGVVSQLSNIGLAYYSMGSYPQALDYYFQALDINSKYGDKGHGDIILGNIGNVYYQQQNFEKALEYDFKALALAEEINDKDGIGSNLGNIGIIYGDMGKYSKALEFLQKADTINNEMGYKEGSARVLGNIGNIYDAEREDEMSLQYHFKALAMEKEIGYNEGIGRNLGAIGYIYIREKKYALAKAYIDSALAFSEKIKEKEDIKTAYSYMADLDSATCNYQAAFTDYKKFTAYKDSLINEANTKKTVQSEMNFDFAQKQAALQAEQDKKDALAEADKRKQTIITWAVGAGLILVLIFAGFVFRSLRITNKQKSVIEKKNKVIEEKNKDILDSINYAKRLQDAILPPLSLVAKTLPESFVLYKPKDIVAGDFYWLERTESAILIAAADCTGHGVPGAMVSVVCSNALNRTVKEFKITEPGKILDKTRELVLETFEKSESNVQDGMDISLASLTPSEGGITLKWSGAFNSLWYIQNNELKELPADKQPIGKTDNPKPFTTHEIKLQASLPSKGGFSGLAEIPPSGGKGGCIVSLHRWLCRPVWRTKRQEIQIQSFK